jgi:DNA-binding transcriptional regulator YiaG
MNEFRKLRREAGLSQPEFAAFVGISAESCRAWDSDRRPVPARILQSIRTIVRQNLQDQEPLPLDQLARELGLNIHTVRAAVRSGRLVAQFQVKSVFGRPVRRATLAAGREFLERARWRPIPSHAVASPLVEVPQNYDALLKNLRRRLRLTQADLAGAIGAAGKAVVYQWESRKRTPSPVLWRAIESLSVQDRIGSHLRDHRDVEPIPPNWVAPCGQSRKHSRSV